MTKIVIYNKLNLTTGGGKMYKAYKFRLYPNNEQKTLIHKTFGCYRFIYNYFLDKCKENKVMKAYDMCSELKEMYGDYPWLKEVDSCSLRCSIFHLEDAYKNNFDKRNNYPSYKKKQKKNKKTGTGSDYRNLSLWRIKVTLSVK